MIDVQQHLGSIPTCCLPRPRYDLGLNMRCPHGSGERIVVKSWLSFSGLRGSRGRYDTIWN